MRLRLRASSGQSTLTFAEDSIVKDLRTSIIQTLGKRDLNSISLKIGYPPKPVTLDDFDDGKKLSDLPFKLHNEQILISDKAPERPETLPIEKPVTQGSKHTKIDDRRPTERLNDTSSSITPTSFSFAGVGEAPPADIPSIAPARSGKPSKPLSLQRKSNPAMDDPPELPIPSRASTLVLRIMPDDNSCLFRAFGSAFFGIMDNMTELRSIIASYIQDHRDDYPEVVLEKSPNAYCRWIQTEDAWGGAIELGILSKHFDIEICSIDVQTLRVDRWNEGRPKRCIIVYSGIHYDTIALSPSDVYSPPELDIKIFDSTDDVILATAVDLCHVLQSKHYFTDTAGFAVKCNVCGAAVVGEIGAADHAKRTGHWDFGEAG